MISLFPLRCRSLVFLAFAVASAAIISTADAQKRPTPWPPPWADTTGESNVYPIGDAVGVYRAVLDLLYVDGNQRPSVIVLWDTAQRHGAGPCVFDKCKDPWVHKSKIDTTALLAFARQSFKRPRIIDFGYRIPIKRVSNDEFQRLRNDGYGYLADRPPEKIGSIDTFWAGFRHKYPRAWGYLMLSKVGFNRARTEALVTVFQICGEQCRSNEIVFLKRFGKTWKVVERIPDYIEVFQTAGNLRYRGPAGERAEQSQIVAIDSKGTQPRAESIDAAKVYAAVLDSLYSFYGESPKSIVLKKTYTSYMVELPVHESRIDSSLTAVYTVIVRVRGDLPQFKYRLPIRWVSDTALKDLEREGAPLARAAIEGGDMEQSPLWYGFHAKYPGAWGYAGIGKVAFNRDHSQALVNTQHTCGSQCDNMDTWFLERKGDTWSVAERISAPSGSDGYMIDGLRYLGVDANPKWYRPRRLHGVVTDAETTKPIPNLTLEFSHNKYSIFVQSDADGRYAAENLPLAGFAIKAKCPANSPSKSTLVDVLPVTPGLDSTMNLQVVYALCAQQP